MVRTSGGNSERGAGPCGEKIRSGGPSLRRAGWMSVGWWIGRLRRVCGSSVPPGSGAVGRFCRPGPFWHTVCVTGGKILLCGNGGSAADCQHFAEEMIHYLSKENPRGPLPAIALTAASSVKKSIANDSTFARVFSRQVEGFGRPGAVLIGISTSGGSRNVVQAVRAARRMDNRVVVLTGSGGVLARIADCALQVPSTNTHGIQETHLLLEHLLCLLSERNLTQAHQAKVKDRKKRIKKLSNFKV